MKGRYGEIIISFLIAFPNLQEVPVPKPKKRKFEDDKNNEKGENVIRTDGYHKQLCSTKYSLHDRDHEVIVAFLGPVAKVSKEEKVIYVKCHLTRSIGWVSFSVSHTLRLEDSDLLNLHSKTIIIKLTQKPFRASGLKSSFESFIVEEDDEKMFMSRLVNPYDLGQQRLKRLPPLNRYWDLLPQPSSLHYNVIVDKITKVEKYLEDYLSSGDMIQRISKFSQGVQKEMELFIQGEQLFYEKEFWATDFMCVSKALLYGGVWLSTIDLLSDEQRIQLNPFSIHAQYLSQVPHEVLDLPNLEEIQVVYSLDNIIGDVELESIKPDNSAKLFINNVRAFLINRVSRMEMFETLNETLFTVKVFGILKLEPLKQEVKYLFGQRVCDSERAKRQKVLSKLKEMESFLIEDATAKMRWSARKKNTASQLQQEFKIKRQLLAVGFLDCSALARGEYFIDTTIPLDNGLNFQDYKGLNKKGLKKVNIMEAHYSTVMPVAMIPNEAFLRNNTHMKLCIQVASTLIVPNSPIQSYIDYCGRVLMVIEKRRHAALILQAIYKWNEPLSNHFKKVPFVPYFNAFIEPQSKPFGSNYFRGIDSDVSYDQPPVTGFMVDCLDHHVFFLEGPPLTALPQILAVVDNFQPDDGKLLYDSSIVFTKRLYKDLLPVGGLYVTTLSEPLSSILKRPQPYLEGHVPFPAGRALLLLDQLRNCSDIRIAIQNNLLPTPYELFSFDLEFGVPVGLL